MKQSDNINERQRAARQLTSEFMGYLNDQEQLVERIVECRFAAIEDRLQAYVREQVAQELHRQKATETP